MEFRRCSKQDREQVENLWDYCFEKKDEPFFKYYFQHYCYAHNEVWGAFAEDKLQCMLHLNPYTIPIRGSEESVPYIVGVATAPAARGQHLMGNLMEACLKELKKQGLSFVYLMPIYAGIYLPYGFAFCYERLKYKWLKGKLTLSTSGSQSDALTFKAGAVLAGNQTLQQLFASMYNIYLQKVNNAPLRDPKDWEKLVGVYAGDGFKYVVVYKSDKAIGYLIYGVQENCLELVELISLEPCAKLALLQYVEQLAAPVERCEWLAEAWDTTYINLQDAAHAPQKLPFMMARCINTLAALSKLAAPKALAGEVVIKVEDKLLAENNCVALVSCQAGSLEVKEKALGVEPEVTMDIAAFTQLYFGFLSATELWEANRIEVTANEKLAFLDALFPKTNNWINEYY